MVMNTVLIVLLVLYLAGNCCQCQRPSRGGMSRRELRAISENLSYARWKRAFEEQTWRDGMNRAARMAGKPEPYPAPPPAPKPPPAKNMVLRYLVVTPLLIIGVAEIVWFAIPR
jgi:hypothetical protein